MEKRADKLEKLERIINEGNPTETLFELGEGEKRTGLLVTYIDGESIISDRITSSPLIKLYNTNGRISMDIDDSDKGDRYSYKNLKPQGAVFGHSRYFTHEFGDLAINLGNNKTLGISHYARPE